MRPVTAPVVVLVAPQLGENIGMAARAMANFGMAELRLVAPRDGWPNPAAAGPAVGAGAILDAAVVFATTREAVADMSHVVATTARPRGQMKRVLAPDAALADLARRIGAGQRVGILFGPERTGLGNDDVSLADAVLTFPVDPAFASLNLAGAVLLAGYEWARTARAGPVAPDRPPPAGRAAVHALFDAVEAELDRAGFYPPDKRPVMSRNMRDMFHRMELSEQDVRTWRGAIRALADGRARRRG